MDSGELVAGEGLANSSQAHTVRVRDGETVTSDGPFAELKEHLAGFYLVEVASFERAVEIAARIPDARDRGGRGAPGPRPARHGSVTVEEQLRELSPQVLAVAGPPPRGLRPLRGRRAGSAARGLPAVAVGGRARQPEGVADHGRVAALDGAVAQRVRPGAPRAGRRGARASAVAGARGGGGRLAGAAGAVLPPGAAPAVPGRADAARGRRADDGGDRPRAARARGDGGAAHQPREGAHPRGRRDLPAPARGRAPRAAGRRAADPLRHLHRGLDRQLRRRAAPRRAQRRGDPADASDCTPSGPPTARSPGCSR